VARDLPSGASTGGASADDPPRQPPKKQPARPFTLSADDRERLATILRPLRNPALGKRVIDALEEQARDFVETTPVIKAAASGNSNRKVLAAVAELRCSVGRARTAIGALPPRARDLVAEMLHFERAVPPGLLPRLTRDLRHVEYAPERVRAAVAPAPTGGRPVDHRGQNFAAELAMIPGDIGIQPTTYVDGPLAQCLEVLFVAVGHQPGDMRTLLRAVQKKLGEKPPKTF
jgi:hypothetical protein